MGRVCKCLLDFGWGCNFMLYELYGQSGGTKAARTMNEWLVDCCREEQAGEEGIPTFIKADFNITPTNLNSVKELVDDELWEDVGSVAGWWGGTSNETTCRTSAGAKPTRIDGILANLWALPYIKAFRVYKDEQIPTHSVIEMTLTSENVQEERTYVKTLPSLKALFDKEVEAKTEGKEAKEKCFYTKRKKGGLKIT